MRTIPLDNEVWGQARLFNWPGLSRSERETKADQVVDAFHHTLAHNGINAQWVPRVPELRVRDDADVDLDQLTAWLEAAYEAVAGA